jgi:hypothetical protein
MPLKFAVALLHQLRQSHLKFSLVALPMTVALMVCRCNLWCYLWRSQVVTVWRCWWPMCPVFFQMGVKFLHKAPHFIFFWKYLQQLQHVRLESKSLTEDSPCCGFWDSELSASSLGWLIWTLNGCLSDLLHILSCKIWDFYGDKDRSCGFLSCCVIECGEWTSTIWRNMLPPSSGL